MISITVWFTVIFSTFGWQSSVIASSVAKRTSSPAETGCLVGGILHPFNASFITKDCSLLCYCTIGGVAGCVDLCPAESSSKCSPGTKLQIEEVPADSGGKCICKRRFCVATKVVCRLDNGEKYKAGETFTYGNCSKSCRCNENGQISCTPLCSKVPCPRGTQSKRKDEIAMRSGCSCEIRECVPVARKFCWVDGRRFKPGRAFITKDCKRKCRCRKNGVPRCVPLCKSQPPCGQGQRKREIKDKFAGGRCSCERKVCSPKKSYNQIDKVYRVGERL